MTRATAKSLAGIAIAAFMVATTAAQFVGWPTVRTAAALALIGPSAVR